jgi:hypothetical protein
MVNGGMSWGDRRGGTFVKAGTVGLSSPTLPAVPGEMSWRRAEPSIAGDAFTIPDA